MVNVWNTPQGYGELVHVRDSGFRQEACAYDTGQYLSGQQSLHVLGGEEDCRPGHEERQRSNDGISIANPL